ncbi:calcium uptake protein, mitochondrial-like [Oryza brachyantha]|nr:calcium uptake protein, mitochondrial-like [Oryza brachyantha]
MAAALTRAPSLRSAIRRLGSSHAFFFASAAASAPRREARAASAAAAAAVAAGSGLGIWLLPPIAQPLADSGQVGNVPAAAAAEAFGGVASAEEEEEEPEERRRFLFGDSYRRRVFFNYEKRIRTRSPPEKIFEYFASVRNPEGEVYMLPADLMRAVVPVFPPSESKAVREGRLRGERNPGELHCSPSEFFMLFDTNGDGLISFAEYIFFVTLLSIPESSFNVAFKMFDLDHNGKIDKEEFKKVMTLMRSYNRQGAAHRDGLRFGLKVGQSVENGGLVEYFFGKDGNDHLHYDTFSDFLKQLHDEIVRLEFSHYDVKSSKTISVKDFALSMVASADMNHINKLIDRVDDFDVDPDLKDLRVTFEEFKAFADLRRKLEPFAMAIFSYGKINGLLTKQDLKRAANHVCGVDLTDKVVDVIFHVFDANQDGSLSADEFLRALQRRESDIRQPATSGLLGVFTCLLNCTKCSVQQMVI